MKALILLITLNLICVRALLGAEDGTYPSGTPYYPEDKGTYEGGFVPIPPAPFSDTYKNYQVLPSSVSPNKQYGLIYPQRAHLYEVEQPHLLLTELKPFHVLTNVPLPGSILSNAHGYYAVNWAANSTAVTIIEGSKWGPAKVYLIPMNKNGIGDITELTSKVRSQVLLDFKRAKVEPYNENFDFIFDSEDRVTGNGVGTILAEKGWEPNTQGQVTIDCTCTTEPRPDMGPHVWTVRFQGIWDTARSQFVRKTFTRVSPTDPEPKPHRDKSR